MNKWFLALLLVVSFPVLGARPDEDNLTQKLARARKEMIKGVSYGLRFKFYENAEGYDGLVSIRILTNHQKENLLIDSGAKHINSVKIQGRSVPFKRNKAGLEIDRKYLKSDTTIDIEFSNSYVKSAGGILRSRDPEDKAEYIYTDFEPYNAHHLFPCLDQPDLKADFMVSVTAPKIWKVISNELVASTETKGDVTETSFRRIGLISTYLFFLGMGPFHEWTDSYKGLPLSIYSRKSLAKYVDADIIFDTTKKGLKFFNEYFAYPYPFSKYGQIFIPEFAFGGMENPGAVTLNERNIFRSTPTASLLARRDNLILHEMAHMWFGDLVTMEWWNDLWLNESFATYAASVAQERGLGSKGTWMSFLNGKTWGYWQDQLSTTHPIEASVPDVRTAKGNFDGITYAKGASALKQLHYFVGEEGFREGLRNYFKKFAWRNTQRKDFIGSIADASKINLDAWTKQWLQTAGPNRVRLQFTCKDGKVQNADLKQEKSVSGALSPHRTRIGFYLRDEDELDLDRTFEVKFTEASTPIKEMIGADCPDFVLPNLDDQDYALYSLDAKSAQIADVALTGLQDPLSRYMVWDFLHQMVRDQKMPAVKYFEMALQGLKEEQDDLLIGFLLGRKSTLRNDYWTYLSRETREKIAPKLEEILWNRILESRDGSSIQIAFFDFYVSVAQTKTSVDRLAGILSSKGPEGIAIDQDRRWAIITALASNGHAEAANLIKAELLKDSSTTGQRAAFAAEAALPRPEVKRLVWERLWKPREYSFQTLVEAAARFNGPNHQELSAPYIKEFFKRVSRMDWKSHDDVMKVYFENLFPFRVCTSEVVEMSKKGLKSARNLTSLARRAWREAQDELIKCSEVRQ